MRWPAALESTCTCIGQPSRNQAATRGQAPARHDTRGSRARVRACCTSTSVRTARKAWTPGSSSLCAAAGSGSCVRGRAARRVRRAT
eukprot:2326266-Prymnesium_polylepis.2